MAEYIERDKAIKKMCEGCNIEFSDEPCEPYDCRLHRGLREIPTADVVEVVRCKDCEHCIVNKNHPDKPLICTMTKMCGTTTPEWYCAAGERKEGLNSDS